MRDFFKYLRDTGFAGWIPVCIILLAMVALSVALTVNDMRRRKDAQDGDTDIPAYSISARPVPVAMLDDSSKVYAAPVATASKAEIKKMLPSKASLKVIGVTPSQVAAVDVTASVTHDSVRMQPPDSLLLAHGAHPSTFSYRDKWVDFSFSLADSVLRYSVRDSITTVVVREYRHRFLWWRWGTKGYHVKVVNHNPHSTLLYKRFVKKE